MQRGFSLVELSIVLVILGLLTGGILAGQSLIRAAELRAITSEHDRFVAAVQTFRDKYFAIPGDMTNATKFWTQSTACAGGSATGVCDGNGNGLIGANAASTPGETQQIWRHLAMAGLIEGSYTGIAGAGGAWNCTVGDSCPRSRMGNAGWGVHGLGNYPGDGGWFAAEYGNVFIFGRQSSTEYPSSPAIKPEELWNIDTKMDDGRPGYGKVLVIGWPACTNAASQTDRNTTYKLDNTAIACGINFANEF